MLLKMFAIYDSAARCYRTPFFLQEEGEAVRAVKNLVNDPQTVMSQHPSDYSLFHVGAFDNATGMCEPTEPKVVVQFAACVNRLAEGWSDPEFGQDRN